MRHVATSQSSSDEMYILFTTDNTVSGHGFEIQYWSSGNITTTMSPAGKTGKQTFMSSTGKVGKQTAISSADKTGKQTILLCHLQVKQVSRLSHYVTCR